MKKITFLLVFAISIFSSCETYRGYESLEVVDDTYTGELRIDESVGDIDGTFSGIGDSGTFSFVWDNPSRGAVLVLDVISGSGTVQLLLNDSRGEEVLNETLTAAAMVSLSQATTNNRSGKWLVTLVFTDFDGEGTFDLGPST